MRCDNKHMLQRAPLLENEPMYLERVETRLEDKGISSDLYSFVRIVWRIFPAFKWIIEQDTTETQLRDRYTEIGIAQNNFDIMLTIYKHYKLT